MTTVTIDGVSYGMKYGHSALKKFMHKYGLKKMMELGDLPNRLLIDDMPDFVKAGFDTWAKTEERGEPFSKDEIKDLLDSHLWLETAALEAFAKSIERPKIGEEEEEKEPKEISTEGN